MPAKPYLVLIAALLTVAACGNTGSSGSPDSASTAAGRTVPSPAQNRKSDALPDGYDPKRNPTADIAAALAKSKADGHPVLLDFGANWCPDCVVLEKTFRTGTVRPVIGGFHVVAIDVGRFDRHLDVARRYHLRLQTSGIPALVVLSDTGKVRTTTNDGSFANARTMTARQVAVFLKRWR